MSPMAKLTDVRPLMVKMSVVSMSLDAGNRISTTKWVHAYLKRVVLKLNVGRTGLRQKSNLQALRSC
jgi:hypothetical protein